MGKKQLLPQPPEFTPPEKNTRLARFNKRVDAARPGSTVTPPLPPATPPAAGPASPVAVAPFDFALPDCVNGVSFTVTRNLQVSPPGKTFAIAAHVGHGRGQLAHFTGDTLAGVVDQVKTFVATLKCGG